MKWAVTSQGDIAFSQYLYKCAFSPDGRLLAVGSDDNCVLLFDVANNYSKAHTLSGFSNWVRTQRDSCLFPLFTR